VDVYATRELGGERARFVRLAPGGVVVADVGGRETLTPRAQWLALPLWQAAVRQPRRRRAGITPEALEIATLFALVMICETPGFVASLFSRAPKRR
jgi:hypothetical protein